MGTSNENQQPHTSKGSWWTRYRHWRQRNTARIVRHPLLGVTFVVALLAVGAISSVLMHEWREHRAVAAWERNAAPTIAASIARLQSELEALPNCTISEDFAVCTDGLSLSVDTTWKMRTAFVGRLRPQMTVAADSLYIHGRTVSNARSEIWLEFEDIERSLRELENHVADLDEPAFIVEIAELRAYVSRASATVIDYGFTAPTIDWPPAESIYVEP